MSKKILIVEDEFIVANDLRLILVQAGYSVNGIAATVEEAGEYLLKQTPDIVILDIRLKGKQSGIDLARKLRAENIAFIYLSAYSNQKILEEAKTTEPYGFLVKPFRAKDLLVTLDIAWYRHTHSLESKLRQEENLQKQLTEIANETSAIEQKLLKIARALQAYIPFDFIASGLRSFNTVPFHDKGYLRIGYDEYQFIGETELKTITGLKESAFSAITDNMQKLLFDSFGFQSYIEFPVTISDGLSIHYFFYSRQPGIYSKSHVDLLNRLKTYLTNVTPVISQPGYTGQKNSDVSTRSAFESIIGGHHLLLAALDLAAQVAPYNTSVLILGESGTGKEKVAQSIHTLSKRKNGPFIKINCAAIPATLIESELFGHEKGAFTGALQKRTGRFEQADGGTVFLDEIGELPLEMQAKLLRVLQEKEIEHVGGSSSIKVNVRIVAATNRNLEKEVAEGKFRLDLYYRLNVFPITMPPLRERKTDIKALTLFFANRFCKEFNKPFNGIATSMMSALLAYDWPGNIRELENVLEQCVILNDDRLQLELKRSLPGTTTAPAGKPVINTLEDVKHVQMQTEKEYIISVLKKTNGRIRGANGAAALLNIKPTTLESKMAKLNIRKEEL